MFGSIAKFIDIFLGKKDDFYRVALNSKDAILVLGLLVSTILHG